MWSSPRAAYDGYPRLSQRPPRSGLLGEGGVLGVDVDVEAIPRRALHEGTRPRTTSLLPEEARAARWEPARKQSDSRAPRIVVWCARVRACVRAWVTLCGITLGP